MNVEEFNKFFTLPLEDQERIALQLDIESLLNLQSTWEGNIAFESNIFENALFWKKKYLQDWRESKCEVAETVAEVTITSLYKSEISLELDIPNPSFSSRIVGYACPKDHVIQGSFISLDNLKISSIRDMLKNNDEIYLKDLGITISLDNNYATLEISEPWHYYNYNLEFWKCLMKLLLYVNKHYKFKIEEEGCEPTFIINRTILKKTSVFSAIDETDGKEQEIDVNEI